jgi:hypothetical protein
MTTTDSFNGPIKIIDKVESRGNTYGLYSDGGRFAHRQGYRLYALRTSASISLSVEC